MAGRKIVFASSRWVRRKRELDATISGPSNGEENLPSLTSAPCTQQVHQPLGFGEVSRNDQTCAFAGGGSRFVKTRYRFLSPSKELPIPPRGIVDLWAR